MHLLILEYVTAGGSGPANGQALCHEADLMAVALARDFGQLPGMRVTLPRCPSLPWPEDLPAAVTRAPALQRDQFARLVRAHDAVLLVAPESAHILHALAAEVESLGVPLLGPSAAAIACAGDKWFTSLALSAAGVAQVPTAPAGAPWPAWPGPWLLKPADGCGCEGLRRFGDQAGARAAAARLPGGGAGWLAQPWMPGVAASLTVLASDGGVQLLSVNRQHITVDPGGRVTLEGVETGALRDDDGHLAAVARAVHAAIPGLRGLWGIDVLLQGDGVRVVDVNPRTTSAYPGLAAVLGTNPAALWLAALRLQQPAPGAALAPVAAGRRAPAVVLGWDIGGAHLKVAALGEDGRLLDVVQKPCALWQGLDRLDPLLDDLCWRWGTPRRHALTMSGEMVDLFPDRAHGVTALVECFLRHAGRVPVSIYASAQGWLAPAECAGHWAAIASANWLTMGDWAARELPVGVVLDLGSTTCDALCFHGGRARPVALGDAGRLTSGELVYTGVARTPLMALAHQVNLGGRAVGVMAEWFASSADVYRVLGQLPEDTDLHPSADGGAKTLEGSVRRLARMVGCDGPEWPLAAWRDVARQFRTVQIDRIDEALALALDRLPAHLGAPVVVLAGAGDFLLREACERRAVAWRAFDELGTLLGPPAERDDAARALGERASRCAPAVAVAALAGSD